jgi:hypothetical protein
VRRRIEVCRCSAKRTLVLTGLILGAAFIAVYVGIQRSPEPLHLPIAVAGEQLATAAGHNLGDNVSVTEVPSLEEGAQKVRDGDAIAAIGLSSPSTLQSDQAGAKGLSESTAARALCIASPITPASP